MSVSIDIADVRVWHQFPIMNYDPHREGPFKVSPCYFPLFCHSCWVPEKVSNWSTLTLASHIEKCRSLLHAKIADRNGIFMDWIVHPAVSFSSWHKRMWSQGAHSKTRLLNWKFGRMDHIVHLFVVRCRIRRQVGYRNLKLHKSPDT